jgi:AhpC/TSA family
MMRIRSKASQARPGAKTAWLVATLAVSAACSSAPIEDPEADAASGGSTASAGAPSVIPGTGAGAGTSTTAPTPTAAGPTYEKVDYPAGPYGVGVHATLENFAFLGWHDPVAANYDQTKLETVHLSEYYNPDGRSNVKLIWINASAVWCSVCRAEMADIKNNGVHAAFAPKGVQLIVTLFEDNKYGPAKPLDLHNWGSTAAHAIDFPLLLDPGFKLGAFFTSDATPLNMLVDAKTMKVIDATMGYSSDYWQRVDKLVAKLP